MTKKIACFRNGVLYDLSPRKNEVSLYDDRQIAYSATDIVSDGKSYSLMDLLDIKRIKIPRFSRAADTVFCLDYILRMCASNLRNAGENELSIAVLEKAVEIMPYSGLLWKENDFLRLVLWLYEDGRFVEGNIAEKRIRTDPDILRLLNSSVSAKEKLKELSEHGDLVAYVSYGKPLCKQCDILSGRVFSLSGKTKRYPKLPAFLANNGGYHVGCNAALIRYWKGDEIYYKGNRVDAEVSTFRKYVDDRTQEEIAFYQSAIEQITTEHKQRQLHFLSKKEYNKLKYIYPDLAPKSFAAFTRLIKTKPEKYSELKSLIDREES